jgi:hypothetical protein
MYHIFVKSFFLLARVAGFRTIDWISSPATLNPLGNYLLD